MTVSRVFLVVLCAPSPLCLSPNFIFVYANVNVFVLFIGCPLLCVVVQLLLLLLLSTVEARVGKRSGLITASFVEGTSGPNITERN